MNQSGLYRSNRQLLVSDAIYDTRKYGSLAIRRTNTTMVQPTSDANVASGTIQRYPEDGLPTKWIYRYVRDDITTCHNRDFDISVAAMLRCIAKRSHIADRPVHLSILSYPSIALITLLSNCLRHDGVKVTTLPVDYYLLRHRLDSCLPTTFKKHIVDNWRSILVEAHSDALVTTDEYYSIVSPLGRELGIPVYLLTDRPGLLSEEEYISAKRAGHGYFDYINCAKGTLRDIEWFSLHSSTDGPSRSMLHVLSEIGSCNSKVAVHNVHSLNAELNRIRGILELRSDDCILNCLPPHGLSFMVHSVANAFDIGADVHLPLKFVPFSQYLLLKPQFPLTIHRNISDTVKLSLGQSAFEYVRQRRLAPTVLMCDGEMFRLLVRFICCEELSTTERSAYSKYWSNLSRVYIFDDGCELINKPLHDLAKSFSSALGIKPDLIQLYTQAEVGVIATVNLSDSNSVPKALPGCKLIDGDTSLTVEACTDSVFQGYLNRIKATESVFDGKIVRLDFAKKLGATILLRRHTDYVRYFKRRRERMSRYPQGYIKQVPVRTQFWGNFTGRRRHPSVL
uniref:AMP-dependent synthetase/ligase domain-containing protein n=1 Tax=Babesia bovis TaxID=5865 RepID=A7AVR6_BABBO|eukprot:XP_001609460.1 hypothetical protein [Babesia bovis T2Bo]